MGKFQKVTLQTRARKISASVDGGLSGGSRVGRPGSEDPHRRQRKLFQELSHFDYVPFNSNVACLYKGCIVPSFIHRAANLCSLASSRAHNYSLLLKILSCRGQDMNIINTKFKKAISRLLLKRSQLFDKNARDVVVITFDGTSLVHKMLEHAILNGLPVHYTYPLLLLFTNLCQGSWNFYHLSVRIYRAFILMLR